MSVANLDHLAQILDCLEPPGLDLGLPGPDLRPSGPDVKPSGMNPGPSDSKILDNLAWISDWCDSLQMALLTGS